MVTVIPADVFESLSESALCFVTVRYAYVRFLIAGYVGSGVDV